MAGGLSGDAVRSPTETTKYRYENGGKPTNVAAGPKPSEGRGARLDNTAEVPDRQIRIPGRTLSNER
jgi:hypothetical protein